MIRALFTAASGMIVQERHQTIVANNISNASTASFKQQDLLAKEVQKRSIKNMDGALAGTAQEREIGDMSFGVEVDRIHIDFAQGDLEETGIDTDIALQGKGFLKIMLSDSQVGYTRNGKLSVNQQGILTTSTGEPVLGKDLSTGKDVMMHVDDKELTISSNGAVNLNGKKSYQLDIVNLVNIDFMNPLGDSVYQIENGMETTVNDTKIVQGSLEKSNVNPLDQMVKMIEITRNFETNQKVIKTIDQMLAKSASEVGKVR